MSNYLGDVDLGSTYYGRFATVNASGVPTTLGNTPSLEYYVNGGTTGFSSGLTLTTDFNSRTGLNSVAIVVTTSCTGLAAATDISICIAAGTVSGVSLVGYPVIEYSIAKRSPLRPATAGRTLLVSSTGYAGIDWNSIGTPGATQSLSATTLFTATNVTNNVGAVVTAINTIAPARVTAQGIDVGAIVTAVNTIAPARVTAQGIDIGAIVTACNTIVDANVTAVSASGLAAFFLTNSGTTYASATAGSVVYEIATNAGVEASGIASIVWDAALSGHLTSGSTGEALNAAGAAGDPWTTAIPGAYTTGQAGYILGNNVDAAISSRLAPSVSGRALLVSSTGYAGIDWANVGTPGSTVSLSATTLFTATNVTNNVGAVVTAINTIAPARVTAQGIDVGAIVTAFNTIAPARVTAQGINVGAIVTTVATTTAVQSALAAAIWDATMASHLTGGSTGEALNAAGAAGDPWVTSLPGAYTTGSAGNILGSVVQAAVTAIQAKVTGLSFTVSGQVDANVQYVNDTQVTGTGASGDEWGPL